MVEEQAVNIESQKDCGEFGLQTINVGQRGVTEDERKAQNIVNSNNIDNMSDIDALRKG